MLPNLMCEDDEVTDADFLIDLFDYLLTRKARIQALLLKQFWSRQKCDYLTSLRDSSYNRKQ